MKLCSRPFGFEQFTICGACRAQLCQPTSQAAHDSELYLEQLAREVWRRLNSKLRLCVVWVVHVESGIDLRASNSDERALYNTEPLHSEAGLPRFTRSPLAETIRDPIRICSSRNRNSKSINELKLGFIPRRHHPPMFP
jgi:hypothetical protein